MPKKRGFAFVELVITIIAIGIIVLILYIVIKPGDVMKKSRDSIRFADINNIAAALNAYLAGNLNFSDLKGPYASNDPGFNSDSTRKAIDGTGWIPINFTLITGNPPIAVLPIDPINDNYFNYKAAFSKENNTYELDCVFENISNQGKAGNDNGTDNVIYEIGTDLTLM